MAEIIQKKQATCNYKVMIRQSIKHQTIRTSLGVAAPRPNSIQAPKTPSIGHDPCPEAKQYPPKMDILLDPEKGTIKKRNIIFQAAIFRGYLNFQGSHFS